MKIIFKFKIKILGRRLFKTSVRSAILTREISAKFNKSFGTVVHPYYDVPVVAHAQETVFFFRLNGRAYVFRQEHVAVILNFVVIIPANNPNF